MPRGDRTGPNGMGSMTGRAAGYCAGFDTPGFAAPIAGRRQFAGFGGGRGRRGKRNMFHTTGLPGWMRFSAPAAPNAAAAMENETQSLRGVAESLQVQLNAIKQRIADIEGGDATS